MKGQWEVPVDVAARIINVVSNTGFSVVPNREHDGWCLLTMELGEGYASEVTCRAITVVLNRMTERYMKGENL